MVSSVWSTHRSGRSTLYAPRMLGVVADQSRALRVNRLGVELIGSAVLSIVSPWVPSLAAPTPNHVRT